MPRRTWPVDPLPPRPRWVLLWAQGEQVQHFDHATRQQTYRWRWSWRLHWFRTMAELREELRDVVRRAAELYAGNRSGVTGYVWKGGGTVTLADVEILDLRTMTRRPVDVLRRIQRGAARVRRERDRWLADYEAKQRAEKLAQIERLRREVGE